MKTKKLSKKLGLNKKTIANLKNGEMKGAYGGIGSTKKWSNCIVCSEGPCQTDPYP